MPEKRKSLIGASVSAFYTKDASVQVQAMPGEESRMSWRVGEARGKSSIDRIEMADGALLVFSSPMAAPGKEKTVKETACVVVFTGALKSALLAD